MYKYIFLFLFYLIFAASYIYSEYMNKKTTYHDNLENSVCKSLKAAINSFELLNDSYHNQYEAKLAYIIKDASDATTKQRDKIRYRLREAFTRLYNDRKLTDLDTFHVFDKYGRSILRFHRLDRYDDKIIKLRDSLKTISKEMKMKSGFEIGKYATVYRFQYPLFYDGEFVGSYEFGISFNAIDNEMQKLFGLKNTLLLYNNTIDTVTEKGYVEKLYDTVHIGENTLYMLKTTIQKKDLKRFKKVIKILQSSKNIQKDKTSFIEISYSSETYIAIISPTKDINDRYLGFTLTLVEDKVYASILKNLIEELTFAILFGFIAVLFIYKELEYKKYIRNIIDTYRDILIVTDGTNIKDANQAFLDFFNIEKLSLFKKQAKSCICDYFINKPGYIQKRMNNISWLEYIKKNHDKDNIVILKNKDGEERYFKVILEGFSKSNDFILIFNDITKILQKQQELENKAYFDNLTGIYSRERFNYFLSKKLNQRREFSIIMFDIDHFKNINDTYGHDMGDIILKELVKLVSIHIREDDIFARWGGEEFMIIVNTDIIKAEKFANKLREIIQGNSFTKVKHITCSFGVAAYRKDDTFNTIIKRVDTMLYSAKNSGRNCVVVVN